MPVSVKREAIQRPPTVPRGRQVKMEESHHNEGIPIKDSDSESAESSEEEEEDNNCADFYPLPPAAKAKSRFPPGCQVLVCTHRRDATVAASAAESATVSCKLDTIVDVGVDFSSQDRNNIYKLMGQQIECENATTSANTNINNILGETNNLQFAPRTKVTVKLPSAKKRVKGIILGSEHFAYGGGPLLYTIQTVTEAGQVVVHREVPTKCIRYKALHTPKEEIQAKPPEEEDEEEVASEAPPVASLQFPSAIADTQSQALSEHTGGSVSGARSKPRTKSIDMEDDDEFPGWAPRQQQEARAQRKPPKEADDRTYPAEETHTPQQALSQVTGGVEPELVDFAAKNLKPNLFSKIVRTMEHNLKRALYDLPGRYRSQVEGHCLNFHFRGHCAKGSMCSNVKSHDGLTKTEAEKLEQLFEVVMSPFGPIYCDQASMDASTPHDSIHRTPQDALLNGQPNPFYRIVRGNHNNLQKVIKQLRKSSSLGPPLSGKCLDYHLLGYCAKVTDCAWAKSHKKLTRKQVNGIEDQLASVISVIGPLRCFALDANHSITATDYVAMDTKTDTKEKAEGELVSNPQTSIFTSIWSGRKHKLKPVIVFLKTQKCKKKHKGGNPDIYERCLKWHLEGYCDSNCLRASDHRLLTKDEAEQIEKVLAPLMKRKGPIFTVDNGATTDGKVDENAKKHKDYAIVKAADTSGKRRITEDLNQDSKKQCTPDAKKSKAVPVSPAKVNQKGGSIRLYLPGLNYELNFFKELVKKSVNPAMQGFKIRLSGKLLEASRYSRENYKSCEAELDEKCLCVKATPTHPNVPNNSIVRYLKGLENHMVFAMDRELRGFLRISLAVLNDQYHYPVKQGILFAPYPRPFDRLDDEWESRYMTVIRAGSKSIVLKTSLMVSVDLASECKIALERSFPSCYIQVFYGSAAYPKITPFVFISGRKYNDVYDCRRELERQASK